MNILRRGGSPAADAQARLETAVAVARRGDGTRHNVNATEAQRAEASCRSEGIRGNVLKTAPTHPFSGLQKKKHLEISFPNVSILKRNGISKQKFSEQISGDGCL